MTTTVRVQRKTIKFAQRFLREDEVSLSRFLELSLRKYIENKTGKTFKNIFPAEDGKESTEVK